MPILWSFAALVMVELKIIDDEPEKNKQEELRRIVNAWKMLKGLPMEGQASKNWNEVHYRRHMKTAKQFLLLFEDWETAVDCVQFMFEKFEGIGCTFTFETLLKHSDSYREEMGRKKK